MRVPDKLKNNVVFIMVREKQGAALTFVGLGFFVSIPFSSEPEKVFIYFVTARRVLMDVQARSADGYVYVRMNTRDGKVDTPRVRIEHWLQHESDPSVDAVVAPWAPDRRRYAFTTLPSGHFLGAGAGLGVGDEVVLAELGVNPSGKQRNLPMMRSGQIAALPTGPLVTQKAGQVAAYLVEANSSSGFVGYPVYVNVNQGAGRNGGTAMIGYRLLGLMNGPWQLPGVERHPDMGFAQQNIGHLRAMSQGLSVVVPAFKIAELFEHSELLGARRERESRR